MTFHFEDLWEKSENFQKEMVITNNSTIQNIIEELILKINLYRIIDSKKEILEEERQTIKSRILGEILLTITALSLKDNINVYESLNSALQARL